jgi:AcrR family transcriptional regulator
MPDRPDLAAEATGGGRSARKRRAILEAARTVFLRQGYGGTSMDEIAAIASASKQTLYKHFSDKRRLFEQVITEDIDRAEDRSEPLMRALREADDVEAALRQFARQHVTVVTQPHLVQMRRILISEADRFPELARTWYDHGPERAHKTLADVFHELDRRGRLRVDDPHMSAQHFNWLVLSIPLTKAMFYGSDTQFTPAELQRYADEAVRVFLAAYGP